MRAIPRKRCLGSAFFLPSRKAANPTRPKRAATRIGNPTNGASRAEIHQIGSLLLGQPRRPLLETGVGELARLGMRDLEGATQLLPLAALELATNRLSEYKQGEGSEGDE